MSKKKTKQSNKAVEQVLVPNTQEVLYPGTTTDEFQVTISKSMFGNTDIGVTPTPAPIMEPTPSTFDILTEDLTVEPGRELTALDNTIMDAYEKKGLRKSIKNLEKQLRIKDDVKNAIQEESEETIDTLKQVIVDKEIEISMLNTKLEFEANQHYQVREYNDSLEVEMERLAAIIDTIVLEKETLQVENMRLVSLFEKLSKSWLFKLLFRNFKQVP